MSNGTRPAQEFLTGKEMPGLKDKFSLAIEIQRWEASALCKKGTHMLFPTSYAFDASFSKCKVLFKAAAG